MKDTTPQSIKEILASMGAIPDSQGRYKVADIKKALAADAGWLRGILYLWGEASPEVWVRDLDDNKQVFIAKIPTSSAQFPNRFIVVVLDKGTKEYDGKVAHHFATVEAAKKFITEEYGIVQAQADTHTKNDVAAIYPKAKAILEKAIKEVAPDFKYTLSSYPASNILILKVKIQNWYGYVEFEDEGSLDINEVTDSSKFDKMLAQIQKKAETHIQKLLPGASIDIQFLTPQGDDLTDLDSSGNVFGAAGYEGEGGWQCDGCGKQINKDEGIKNDIGDVYCEDCAEDNRLNAEKLDPKGGWSPTDGYDEKDGHSVRLLSKEYHGISLSVYPKGQQSTNQPHGKPGKPNMYLWEIWYDDLVASGYGKTLDEAKRDCLMAYHEKCEGE